MQLVNRGMLLFVMALIVYRSNDNGLRVLEKVDWMFFHSHCKHLYQKQLPTINQFSEPVGQRISDCEP